MLAPLLRGRPDPEAGATAVDQAGGDLAFKELMLQRRGADYVHPSELLQAGKRDHLRPVRSS